MLVQITPNPPLKLSKISTFSVVNTSSQIVLFRLKTTNPTLKVMPSRALLNVQGIQRIKIYSTMQSQNVQNHIELQAIQFHTQYVQISDTEEFWVEQTPNNLAKQTLKIDLILSNFESSSQGSSAAKRIVGSKQEFPLSDFAQITQPPHKINEIDNYEGQEAQEGQNDQQIDKIAYNLINNEPEQQFSNNNEEQYQSQQALKFYNIDTFYQNPQQNQQSIQQQSQSQIHQQQQQQSSSYDQYQYYPSNQYEEQPPYAQFSQLTYKEQDSNLNNSNSRQGQQFNYFRNDRDDYEDQLNEYRNQQKQMFEYQNPNQDRVMQSQLQQSQLQKSQLQQVQQLQQPQIQQPQVFQSQIQQPQNQSQKPPIFQSQQQKVQGNYDQKMEYLQKLQMKERQLKIQIVQAAYFPYIIIKQEKNKQIYDEHVAELQKIEFMNQFKGNEEENGHKNKILFWHLMIVCVIFLILGATVKKGSQFF